MKRRQFIKLLVQDLVSYHLKFGGKCEQSGKKQLKPQRCAICERNKDRKSFYNFVQFSKFVCLEHSTILCNTCISEKETGTEY